MKGTSICLAAVALSSVLAAQQAPPPRARAVNSGITHIRGAAAAFRSAIAASRFSAAA